MPTLPFLSTTAAHQAPHREGIDLTLAELLASAPHRGKVQIPRIVREPQEGGRPTKFKGRGMNYDESRDYQPGDEIRHMDWKVTARTGKPHTKIFRSERGRSSWVVLDQSACLFFATRRALKSVLAARLAAQAIWRAQAQGDRIGIVRFDDEQQQLLPPVTRRPAILQGLHLFIAHHQRLLARPPRPAAPGVALLAALQKLQRELSPGAALTVITDSWALQPAQQTLWAHLARHHEVQLYTLHDVIERELPPPALYAVQDSASAAPGSTIAGINTGSPRHIDTSDASLRGRHAEAFTRQLGDWQLFCRQRGIRWQAMDTGGEIAGNALAPMGGLDLPAAFGGGGA